jgi:hypothetical protein
MTEPTLFQLCQDYLLGIIAYWWALLPGVVMPLPDIYKWLHPKHRELRIPHGLRIGSVVAALFLAQFLVYRNSERNLTNVIEEKQELSRQVYSVDRKLEDQTSQWQVDEQKLAALRRPESPSSLRRRTIRLADEIEAFVTKEQAEQAQFMQEHGNDQKAMRDFQIESQSRFVSTGLQSRAIEIVQELEGKGLPVGLGLKYVSQNGYFGLDLEHLRDLAYRLDGSDNLVAF